jgi:hypothetical protein
VYATEQTGHLRFLKVFSRAIRPRCFAKKTTPQKIRSHMSSNSLCAFTIVTLSITALVRVPLAAQDAHTSSMAANAPPTKEKYMLTVPDGLAFSEIKGYETWSDVAVSETETSVKAIVGNRAMIDAYKAGIPGNGKPFPEGVKVVKIEWLKKKNPVSPYPVQIPDTLKSVSFIIKDSKRFPNTHGWAYAQFSYDPASGMFKPSVTGAECGFACHTKVASDDYIYTAYPTR